MTMTRYVYLALHYQNENCHPDGAIKVGIAQDAPWREERLNNAQRLVAGIRKANIPVVHVRLAVEPDYADVVQNTPIIREWVSNGAWREGTWGCEWLAGFEPQAGEIVVTHTRNSVFSWLHIARCIDGLKSRTSDIFRCFYGLCGRRFGAPCDGYRLSLHGSR